MTGRPALALLLALVAVAAADDRPRPVAVGDKVTATNQLRDVRGGLRPLAGFAGHKAVVLAFVGADCPVSNLYLPGLIELEKQYRGQGRTVPGRLPERAGRPRPVRRPRLRPRRAVPRPEGRRAEAGRHRGRDPRPGRRRPRRRLQAAVPRPGRRPVRRRAKRPKATRADLAEALDEVAGRQAGERTPETEADGCLVGRRDKPWPDRRDVREGRRPDPAEALPGLPPAGPGRPVHAVSYDDAVKHAADDQGSDHAAAHAAVARRPALRPLHQRPPPDARRDRHAGRLGGRRHGPRATTRTCPSPSSGPRAGPTASRTWCSTMPEEYEVPATGRGAVQELDHRHRSSPRTSGCRWPRPGRATPAVVHHVVAYIMKDGASRTRSAPDGTISDPGRLGAGRPGPGAARRTRPCASPRGRGCGWRCTTRPTARRRRTARPSASRSPTKPPKYELLHERVRQHGRSRSGRTTRTTRRRRRCGCGPTPGWSA